MKLGCTGSVCPSGCRLHWRTSSEFFCTDMLSWNPAIGMVSSMNDTSVENCQWKMRTLKILPCPGSSFLLSFPYNCTFPATGVLAVQERPKLPTAQKFSRTPCNFVVPSLFCPTILLPSPLVRRYMQFLLSHRSKVPHMYAWFFFFSGCGDQRRAGTAPRWRRL